MTCHRTKKKSPKNIKVKVISIIIALGTTSKDLIKGPEKLEIRGRPKVGQNTKKIPGDLSRFAVTHASVKDKRW